MTKVAIIQSNYIPWKGYFDIIHDVDVFVFLDDVQMTKRDWRTRNKIKTPNGTMWLTVPVSSRRHQLIHEAQIVQDIQWQKQHAGSLQANYGQAPFFHEYGSLLELLYEQSHENLSQFNRQCTTMLCEILGIKTELLSAMDFDVDGVRDDRLLNICREVGATSYLSGPSAQSYLDEEKFFDAGIAVEFKDYAGYPEYPQMHPPFDHAVSVLDLLFHCGPAASDYIWGWREEAFYVPTAHRTLVDAI